jgi:hypothetical protein
MNKKELIEQLRKIEAQEKQDLIDKHLPVFREKYVGKFFKIRNSYGNSGSPWFMYSRVDSIESENIVIYSYDNIQASFKGISFQTDCNGKVMIDTKYFSYTDVIRDEITETEFKAAWGEVQKEIDKAMKGK